METLGLCKELKLPNVQDLVKLLYSSRDLFTFEGERKCLVAVELVPSLENIAECFAQLEENMLSFSDNVAHTLFGRKICNHPDHHDLKDDFFDLPVKEVEIMQGTVKSTKYCPWTLQIDV